MRIGSYDVNKLTLQPARKLKRERKEKSRADPSSCLGYSATSADVYIYHIILYRRDFTNPQLPVYIRSSLNGRSSKFPVIPAAIFA